MTWVSQSLEPDEAFDDFVIAVGPANTTSQGFRAAHQDQGLWKMTVDGVKLTRSP